MNEEIYNPWLNLIEDTFQKTSKDDLDKYYLKLTHGITKWTCYSDYCFDNDHKPNDVFCITLVPFVEDFELLKEHIKSIAAVDIKKANHVKENFVDFLKEFPLINFSFIVNDRKKLLGKDQIEQKRFLKQTFTLIKKQVIAWGENQAEHKIRNEIIVKKLNCILKLIENDKKTKPILNMLLVTFYGAYVSSWIIKNCNVEVFGWFSDRDALNEVCNNVSLEMFQYYLHGLTGGREFKFVAAPAKSTDNSFYEELVRIPDYIAGAISDYDMKQNLISKEKFNTILTNYMADNTLNNFVYRLFVDDNGNRACARVTMHKKFD